MASDMLHEQDVSDAPQDSDQRDAEWAEIAPSADAQLQAAEAVAAGDGLAALEALADAPMTDVDDVPALPTISSAAVAISPSRMSPRSSGSSRVADHAHRAASPRAAPTAAVFPSASVTPAAQQVVAHGDASGALDADAALSEDPLAVALLSTRAALTNALAALRDAYGVNARSPGRHGATSPRTRTPHSAAATPAARVAATPDARRATPAVSAQVSIVPASPMPQWHHNPARQFAAAAAPPQPTASVPTFVPRPPASRRSSVSSQASSLASVDGAVSAPPSAMDSARSTVSTTSSTVRAVPALLQLRSLPAPPSFAPPPLPQSRAR